jgi:putative endopeptidase
MLALIGHPDPRAAAASIIAFETQIAAINLPPDQTRDPVATYNYMSLSQLQQLTPHLPWQVYFDALGRPNVTHVIVTVPAFFRALDALVASSHISVLVEYLRWTLLHTTAQYLSTPFVTENFNFYGKVSEHACALLLRSKMCCM